MFTKSWLRWHWMSHLSLVNFTVHISKRENDHQIMLVVTDRGSSDAWKKTTMNITATSIHPWVMQTAFQHANSAAILDHVIRLDYIWLWSQNDISHNKSSFTIWLHTMHNIDGSWQFNMQLSFFWNLNFVVGGRISYYILKDNLYLLGCSMLG